MTAGGSSQGRLYGVILAALAALPIGCRPQPEAGASSKNAVLALVAASTGTAVREVADQFTKKTGIPVKLSPGPSNGLANQILAGAPADIYISANQKWAELVAGKGRAAESRPLLSNRLVLIVPKGNPANVKAPGDLTSPRVGQVAVAGEKVPAGIYADQALRSLKLQRSLAQQKKLVRGEDVRITLSYVARGEAEAGIVYASDARISENVEVVHTLATKRHEAIAYPALLLKSATGQETVRRFYDYLWSPEAEAVFREYGFRPLNGHQQHR